MSETTKIFRDAYHELDEIRHERDTLIAALRECVVALDTALMLSDVPEHAQDEEWYEKRRCLDGSLSSAQTALERYKHEHP